MNGRERLVSLGEYPMVSLARARAPGWPDVHARGARTYADDLITYAQAVVRHFNGRQARGRKIPLDDLDVKGIREAIGLASAARCEPSATNLRRMIRVDLCRSSFRTSAIPPGR